MDEHGDQTSAGELGVVLTRKGGKPEQLKLRDNPTKIQRILDFIFNRRKT